MFKWFKDSKGMTIVEILISLGILAGAAAGLYFGVIKGSDKAKIRQAEGEISKIVQFVKVYKQDTGDYPSTDTGLQALVDEGYVDDVPTDPWKHAYLYEYPGTRGDKFDVCSQGPDVDDDSDDICNGKKEE